MELADIIRIFVWAGFVGVFIGVALFVIEDDVAEREADWFHDPDKWIYRNPFA